MDPTKPSPPLNEPAQNPEVSVSINQYGETICSADASSETSLDGKPPHAASAELTSIGRYRIDNVLGQGGFGAVYKGFDDQLERPVAIKVPLLNRKEVDAQEEFLREARQLARLAHSGIVSVHDIGVDEGRCFIVTEFLEGHNLNEWMRQKSPKWIEAVRIVANVADALAHAHAMNTVHRDVKPANIIMVNRPEGLQPVLVDFGLAISDAAGHQQGRIVGTPNYMSPEQARGETLSLDGRTDVYALGVIMYRLLCGHLPFESNRLSELLDKVINEQPKPPSKYVPGLRPELEQICLKAMSKDVAARYPTATAFARALRGSFDVHAETVNVPGGEAPPPDQVQEEAPSAIRRSRQAERRHVTMLACESEFFESDEFAELDPEDQHEFQQQFQKTCGEAVTQFGGVIVEVTSQGILACFGFPVAYEDAARRAVHSGRELLEAIDSLSKKTKCDFNPQLAVHTGSVVAEMSEDSISTDSLSLVGTDKTMTMRLAESAEPGSLVVTAATHELVRGFFGCTSLGSQKVKGAAKPVEIFQVTGESEARHRLDLLDPKDLTPLIGRDTELSILRDRWEHAAEGMGQVVLLIGEAGLGKSRLIREIRDHVSATDPDAALIELRCSSYYQTSGLHPTRDLFERMLDFHRDMPHAEKLDLLVAHLNDFKMATDDKVPLFAAMLSIPLEGRFPELAFQPQKLKELTQQALLEWLRKYSSKQPVLFIVEDLHWVDPSTLELLGLLMEEGFHESILTVLTFRPEFKTPWTSAAHQTQVALNRLTRRQVGQMMREQTGIRNLSDDLVSQIVERTDGVPLFVEEFTRVIRDSDELQDIDGSVQLSGTFALENIPASLHDLLISRLDRMDSLHEVVQLGATLGREFRYDLMCAASDLDEATLQAEMDKLVKAEVLFQKGRPPDSSFIFKHALIQDAAYDSLLKKTRQQFHRQIATALEEQFPDSIESEPELLAHHFSEANETEKAIGYWLKAGVKAQHAFANLEAISHFERGLELVESLPESPERDGLELQFKVPLSAVLMGAKGYAAPEVGPIHNRAIEICRKLQAPFLFGVMEANWAWLFIGAKFDQGYARSYELIAMAEESGDPGQLCEAHWTLTCIALYNGDFPLAFKHSEISFQTWNPQVSAEYAKLTQQNSGPLVLTCTGAAKTLMGFLESGPAIAHQALELSIEIKDVFTQTIMEWKLAQQGEFIRDGELAFKYGSRAVELAKEQSFMWWIAIGTCGQGVALHLLGRHKEAIQALREGIAISHATGAGILFAKYNMWLAVALWHDKQREEAWQTLEEAFSFLETGERMMEAELNRHRGDFHFDQGEIEQAETWYQNALEIARRQGSKLFELRAVMRLCRIWQQQNQNDQAREELATIYGWFSEGLDAVDLVEAKALLDELGSA